MTSAAVTLRLTVPERGPPQRGVPAGPGRAAVPHNQIEMPPLTPFCAMWMWLCVTSPSRSSKVSSYSKEVSSRLIFARNSPVPVLETDGGSSIPLRSARMDRFLSFACATSCGLGVARASATPAVAVSFAGHQGGP